MHDVIVTLLATVNDILSWPHVVCLFYTIRHFGFSSVLFCFL